MAEERKAVITIQDVHKSYGKYAVLDGINAVIYQGDIFGVLGKNGCGKTTLFKTILGLTNFQSGKIQILEEGKPLAEARQKIGFFIGGQFFGDRSARENLYYYADLKQIPKPKEEVERVLKLVDLDKAKGTYQRFSLGMKQRLGIANAILGNPEILILDEPTNGLDPQGIAEIRHLVQRLNQEYGMTVIISSHILGELQHTATRFGIINQGKIVRLLTKEELEESTNILHVDGKNWERAKGALEQEGLKVYDEKLTARSLEDYYFELIGGAENA